MTEFYSGIDRPDVIDLVSYNLEKKLTTLSILQEAQPESINVNELTKLLKDKIEFYLEAWKSGQIHDLYKECSGTTLEVLIAIGFEEESWIRKAIDDVDLDRRGDTLIDVVHLPSF
jgi:hypothetical protein